MAYRIAYLSLHAANGSISSLVKCIADIAFLFCTAVASYPASKKHLYNICTTLAQRLRRWSNIVQMLYKCFVFAGIWLYSTAPNKQMNKPA